jgi:plastocyanin
MGTKAFLRLLFVAAVASRLVNAGVVKGKVKCNGVRDNRDAIVYIESISGDFPSPKQPASIDQYRMEFIPHVLPILVGTTVQFLNSDPAMHNVFTPSKAGNEFNLGTWTKGQIKTYTFNLIGEVRLLCSVHPEMEGWIVVFANPYFAKTRPDGGYTISDVPSGKYVVRVWHEKLKFAPAKAQVPTSGEVSIDAIEPVGKR